MVFCKGQRMGAAFCPTDSFPSAWPIDSEIFHLFKFKHLSIRLSLLC